VSGGVAVITVWNRELARERYADDLKKLIFVDGLDTLTE
jgi:hypothetical protein